MKKSSTVVGIAVFSSFLLPATIFAQALNTTTSANVSSSVQVDSSINSNHQAGKQEGEQGEYENDQEGAQQIGEMENEEEDIHQQLDTVKDVKADVGLHAVASDHLATYGDAVSLLKNYQVAVGRVNADMDLQIKISAALSDKEKILLDKLMGKHQQDFAQTRTRNNDLIKVMQDLIDVLTPVADQPVSTSFGLKSLLLVELGDFRDQIGNLVNLANLNIQQVAAGVS